MHLEKGLYFSKAYDELPQEVTHTSFILKGDTEDLSEEMCIRDRPEKLVFMDFFT